MSAPDTTLDSACVDALRDHLTAGGESTLNAGYELARRGMEEGLGLVDMVALLHRALRAVATESGGLRLSPAALERYGAFAMECFSPFEMEYRGARDARRALRRMNERSEEHVRRIAYELHDSAGQLLTTVHFALDSAARGLGPDAATPLALVRQRLNEVEVELRRLSHELRPTLLDHLGLLPALCELANGVTKRAGIDVRVVDGTTRRAPMRLETVLYRVVQEALNNAVRHSRATRVEVRVSTSPDELHCTITDNGVGFEPTAANTFGDGPGLGLAGMAERLSPLAGSLRIQSSPGRGVRLDIRLPLEAPRGDAHPAG